MKKHILVVSQYFYPENFRINDICNEWIKRGYKVTVITGIPNYPKGKFFKGYGWFKNRRENYDDIKIIRIPIIPRRNNKIFLVFNYVSFMISGWIWKTFTKIKADIVFNFEVSPMTQALPAVWYAKKQKIPFYIYVQDLWPENLQIVGGVNNRILLKMVNRMVDNVYNQATNILVTSESFKKTISLRGVTAEKIIYWPQYAEDYYKPLESESDNEYFTIMYTGNIGEAQGLEILPELATMAKKIGLETKIKFILIGDGRNKINLERNIYDKNVTSMFTFLGHKKPEEIPNYLKIADVAFLSFSDNELFRMTIPAKLQTYMACAKPIFAVVEGETERIVKESNSGLCSMPSSVEDSFKNLVKFTKMSKDKLNELSNNSLEYYKTNFDKDKLLDQFDLLVSQGGKDVQK